MLNIIDAIRKPVPVKTVQVTGQNITELALWCRGVVRRADEGEYRSGDLYIKVPVRNPANTRLAQAFIGDWIYALRGSYKVYRNRAFRKGFDFPIKPNS